MRVLVDITQLMFKYGCTYNESDTIVRLLQDWIKQSRENREYNSMSDYINGNPTNSVNNEIIAPLNHVDGYC